MVTMEDDNAWDDYVKMDPYAKGMRYKTWAFFRAWREIFCKDRATGNRSADPFKDANDVKDEQIADMQECNLPNAEWNPDIGVVGLDEDPLCSFNVNVDPVTNSSSAAKRAGSTSSGKRKRTDASFEIPKLIEMVSTFCESANTRLAMLTRVHESEFGHPEHRVMILEQVRELDSFDENEHLIVANRLVKDPKEMELFLALSKDSRVKMVQLMLAGNIEGQNRFEMVKALFFVRIST
ncbi:UNVERIFIED_CONTAM: hypothetical protein Sindi_2684500 [Sesamum indicum]